jgi:signal transduction histidine kinase
MEEPNIRHISELEQLQKEYDILLHRERQLSVVHDFAISLLHQNSLHDIVWAVAKNAIARLGFVDCVVYIMDSTGKELIQMAAHGPKNPEKLDIKNPIKIPLGKGIVGTVAMTGKSEIIGDTSTDTRYIVDDDFRYSEIAVPILDGNKVIGVIDSEHPDKHFYTDQHLYLLETIAAMAASKILHAQAAEQLKNHQKNLEVQINEKTKDLQEHIQMLRKSNHDLESFAYAASHDLAEPLRTISSFLQLIKRREKDLSPDTSEFIEFAVDGAHRMKKLLDGLLTYSKVGQKTQGFDCVNLEELLNNIKASLSKAIDENNAQIIHQPLQPIYGHEVTLTQLFQNIIANAIKFRYPDRDPLIHINQTEEDNYYAFEITDNGIGMEPEFFEKAFKLFGRLNTIEKYKGSGLGLAVCKRIVENHGGVIWLESNPGQGTKVSFKLPKYTDLVTIDVFVDGEKNSSAQP